jgi:glycosyltransferase involved in cell wall biosynthesis
VVAYHFPPHSGGSGLLRALKFCRYLPEFGWQPTVLTIHPRAYDRVDSSQLADIPPEIEVIRTFGLDTRKHLSVFGAYPRLLALPDRWVSWLASAMPAGLHAIRKKRIDAILTTYPVATAVLIGYFLHRITAKPWIVDFRDSMTEDEYPRDPLTRRVYRWIEQRAVRHTAKVLFTAPATMRMYQKRYPELTSRNCLLLPNGYDEPDFDDCIAQQTVRGPVRLVHSGLIYPWERDPRPFFRALARLKSEGKIDTDTLRVELRACGAESIFEKDLLALGIGDIVHLLPPLPYRSSLRDGAGANALLLLQAGCCDHQIPAKAYEYLRLQKPVLALATQQGDTAALFRSTGGATIVDIANEDAIYRILPEFLQSVRSGAHPLPELAKVRAYSRREQTAVLARCLDVVLEEGMRQPTFDRLSRGKG